MIDKDPHNEIRMSRRGEMRKASSIKSNVGRRLGHDAIDAASPRLRINMGRNSSEAGESPEIDALLFDPNDAIRDGVVDSEWIGDLVAHVEAAGYVGVTWHNGEDTREMMGVIERTKRHDVAIKKGDGAIGYVPTGRLQHYFTRKIEEKIIRGPIQVNSLDD